MSGGRCPAGAPLYEQPWNPRPIGAQEVDAAAAARGDRAASEMTGAAFSDTAMMARRSFGRLAVLHFATHGIAEQRAGCAYAPPALITSMGDAGADGLLGFARPLPDRCPIARPSPPTAAGRRRRRCSACPDRRFRGGSPSLL